MDDFRLIFSRPQLETEVFDVRHERAEHPSGAVLERSIVHNASAAVILPRNDEGAVLLIRQFRLPCREKLWELPAGRCDPGEEPLETAQRELIEETGYRAAQWRPLLSFYPAPGFATERMYSFLAEGLSEGEAAPEPYEIIEKRWLGREEALEMVRSGAIRDAKTIATLLYSATFGS